MALEVLDNTSCRPTVGGSSSTARAITAETTIEINRTNHCNRIPTPDALDACGCGRARRRAILLRSTGYTLQRGGRVASRSCAFSERERSRRSAVSTASSTRARSSLLVNVRTVRIGGSGEQGDAGEHCDVGELGTAGVKIASGERGDDGEQVDDGGQGDGGLDDGEQVNV